MPIQVRGVLGHAMSGTELSGVGTEFRLRPPEPIKQSHSSREPTLLCNQVDFISHDAFRDSIFALVPLHRNANLRCSEIPDAHSGLVGLGDSVAALQERVSAITPD